MNAVDPTPHGDRTPALPELSADRVDRMEGAIFAEIAAGRTAARARRGRLWLVGGAAATVVVVAAVLAPSIGTLVGGAGGATSESAVAPASRLVAPVAGDGAIQLDATPEFAADGIAGDASQSRAQENATSAIGARDIITTASATVVVADPSAAARGIGDAAEGRGGYIESLSLGESGQVVPLNDGGMTTDPLSYPYPYPPTGAWVTVRVPADQLPASIEELSNFGEVTASTVNRQDVTEQTVDLRARVGAAQASVERMTQILGQATSLTDLIAAESALAERQATLESYQQQLTYYDEQVALSTLTVSLSTKADTVQADPAGFGDGLAAGWNGLVATVNGIVIAIGFLLPWIAVLAVIALVVWGIVRLIRRSRIAPTGTAPTGTNPSQDDDA